MGTCYSVHTHSKEEESPWITGKVTFNCKTKVPSFQFSSVAQSCLTLCDPMNCSTPGLPVYHQPPEFTQTHVHRVSDAIQLSHPLSSPSPPAPQSLPAPNEPRTKFPTAYLGAVEGGSWCLVRKWPAGLSPASLHTLPGV